MRTPVRPIDLASDRDPGFQAEVARASGQLLQSCYQCGNCTAGCVYTPDYDYPVHQVMRLVQLGLRERALGCRSLWLCATCQACTTRCPNDIDVARVMDVLRHMARQAGFAPEPGVKTFTDGFLASVAKHGRVFEAGLAAAFALKGGRPMQDASLGLPMLLRGKLSLSPHEPEGHGKAEVAAIFARFAKQGAGPGSSGEARRGGAAEDKK
ncbi:MAG: 4Fe-4S dicluster domain-containing protein [Proteobacteria bacterium]|nr:4Fe-4S dicluster domain-containing protein [Pseudomonadota bacterium]MBU1596636.1 4Fe-4S dicluster domain-containing protein [Pseudomonadota bacterium]